MSIRRRCMGTGVPWVGRFLAWCQDVFPATCTCKEYKFDTTSPSQSNCSVTFTNYSQLHIYWVTQRSSTVNCTSSKLYCLLESHSFGQLWSTFGQSFSIWCYKQDKMVTHTQWSCSSPYTCSCWAGTSLPQCWHGCGLIGHSTSWWVARIRYWMYWPHWVHWISRYSHTGRWACVLM